MTNEKELRREWMEENINNFSLSKDEDFAVAEWWLSKLHSHTKEVVEKIEGLKARPIIGGILGPLDYQRGFSMGRENGYREALDEVINLINQEK